MKTNLKSLLSFLFSLLFISTFFLNKASAAFGCKQNHPDATVVNCYTYQNNAYQNCIKDAPGNPNNCYGSDPNCACDPSDPINPCYCWCCWDDRPLCPTATHTCVPSSACPDEDKSTDHICPDMTFGTVCCKNSGTLPLTCECTEQENHQCFAQPPQNPGYVYYRADNYSCDGCSAPGTTYSCYYAYNLSDGVCGNSSSCMAESSCNQGGSTNLGQLDCGPGEVCCYSEVPPLWAMFYTGPVIQNLEDIIGPASKILYSGGLVIGFFFIILAGYRLMTSQGDPQKAKEAQEQLTSAVVGTIFILLSANILRIIIKIITDIDI